MCEGNTTEYIQPYKKEILFFATTRANLENIVVSSISQMHMKNLRK
jgi:hypothetical protein